jgi:hypothetical protein
LPAARGLESVRLDTLIVYIQNLLYTTEAIENVIATRYVYTSVNA